jgi:phospholipid transport system substrate-binding protein
MRSPELLELDTELALDTAARRAGGPGLGFGPAVPVTLVVTLLLLGGGARPALAAPASGASPTEGAPGGGEPPGPDATASRPKAKTAGKPGSKLAAKTPAAGRDAPDDKDVAPSVAAASSSPMAELKKSNDALNKLLKKKYPTWSPEAEAQKADVRKLVGGFLDYRELARRSLAKHWDTLSPPQRQEFVSTLRELVENSYLKEVTGDPNYVMKYDKEDKTGAEGTEATVEATLSTVSRNKKVDIALVYKLVHKDHWLVYDVITDEQSMLENYRAEFNKIITKDGFDALLKKMKKKLEEKDD